MASDKEDDFFDQVSRMAETIGLSGKEAQRYVHEHMTRAGYDMVPSYIRKEQDGDDRDRDDFFSFQRPRARRTRSNDDDGDRDSRQRGSWF